VLKVALERTGKDHLDVTYLTSRLGSMAMSTKCCGTGTCTSYANPDIKAPKITRRTDDIDAVELSKNSGFIS